MGSAPGRPQGDKPQNTERASQPRSSRRRAQRASQPRSTRRRTTQRRNAKPRDARLPSSTPQAPAAEPVTGCLLIQVAAREPFEVLGLADRAGSGLVFTGAGAIEAMEAMRRHGWRRPMLADRRRYAGTTRVPGTASFVPSWLAGQRDAGISPVLTDSGYIGEGDVAALRSVLSQAAAAGADVTAVLPLHERWLHEDRATLIADIAAYGVPVALVLEHRDDPLGTPEGVAGLIELLRAAPSVAVLGTGIAGLAALAFGAQWTAVGVRGSLRLFPPTPSDDGTEHRKRRWRPAPREVVAAPVLSFGSLDTVVRAYAASEDGTVWACRCSRCRGRTPEWLAAAPALDADAHTFDVLLSYAERLRNREPGPAREQEWCAGCRQALRHYRELGLAGLGWEQPGVATAWASAEAAGCQPPLRSAG